jgi:hypothetical protein
MKIPKGMTKAEYKKRIRQRFAYTSPEQLILSRKPNPSKLKDNMNTNKDSKSRR